jgi:hypoxanthine phosphoribosyltransferase
MHKRAIRRPPCIRFGMNFVTIDLARVQGLSSPLRTLHGETFEQACADLMRLVEADYAPLLLVGIRTGGLVVAGAMASAASRDVPVLPLTCRRPTTATKSRLPLLREILRLMPLALLDLLRRIEHRRLAARSRQVSPEVDHAEADAIGDYLARIDQPARILVVDDAVDSGMTLARVLQLLRAVCPSGTELRTAAVTQTLDHPQVRPDYVLFHELCRFPWSFDAKG